MGKYKHETDKKNSADIQPEGMTLSSRTLWILTLSLAGLYVLYSFLSNGLYQHEEAGHFLNMRNFWHDPKVILGNWAKPGYKLIFVVPALLGPAFLLVFNSIVSAITCLLSYRLAESTKSRWPILAPLFLAAQPFWLQLSFRNYSEPLSALLLTLSIWLHYREKWLFSALALSYLTTIRQEFYPLLLCYAVYLAWKRRLFPLISLLVFPLINNLAGWLAEGDPLYLIHSTFGYGEKIQDAYPRQGFAHYFLMALPIFGALTLVYFIVYLGNRIFYKKRIDPWILIPAGIYFLEHCVFNMKSIRIGPSTGGNLRYLIVIAPLLAVLAARAAEELHSMKDKKRLFVLLIPLAAAVALFMSREHNNVLYTSISDPVPFVTVILAILTVFIPSNRARVVSIGLFAFIAALFAVKPIQISPEDQTVKTVTEWVQANKLDEKPILVNHNLFYYYLGRSRFEMPEGTDQISLTVVEKADPGTVILWENHYSYRPQLHPEHIPVQYLLNRPDQYRQLQVFTSRDNRFVVMAFEKVLPPNEE